MGSEVQNDLVSRRKQVNCFASHVFASDMIDRIEVAIKAESLEGPDGQDPQSE
jgi:hypothetical protein